MSEKSSIILVAFLSVLVLGTGTALAQCPTAAAATYSTTNVTCNGANDGTITVDLNNGTYPPNPNFELYDNNLGSFVTLAVTRTVGPVTHVVFSDLYPSNYQVVVFKMGCSPIQISPITGFDITEPPALIATVNSVSPACTPGTGSIDLDISGGTPGYSFTWSGPTAIGDTEDPFGLDGGFYDVTVKDAKMCQVMISTIEVFVPTVAAAGPDQNICMDNTTLAGNVIQSFETGTWSVVSGTGVFADANDPATTVSGLSYGNNEFKWEITSSCAPSSDNVIINSSIEATAAAGGDQSICKGSVYALAGSSIGGSAATGAWSIVAQPGGGDGMLSSTSQTATPSSVTFTATVVGAYTLRLTTDDPAGPCPAVSDDVDITVDAAATVNAGSNATICSATVRAMTGATVGGSATTAAWSIFSQPGGGDGMLSSTAQTATPATVTFTATVNGVYVLRLTTSDPPGTCLPISDDVNITVNVAATANAGADQSICGGTIYPLAGSSVGGSATTGAWNIISQPGGGNGMLSSTVQTANPSAVTFVATVGGVYTLRLTTNNPAGPCPAVTDNVNITVDPAATANAGADQTICAGDIYALAGSGVGGSATTGAWSMVGQPGGGDGVLSTMAQTATPSSVTFTATVIGTYTLRLTTDDPGGMCVAVSDDVDITVNLAATADAGSDQTICGGTTYALAGASVGGSATTGAWSIFSQPGGGDGLLSSTTQTATPASVTFTATVAGVYTLRLTTNDPAGTCPAVSDDVDITVNLAATANAGSDQTICAADVFALAGSSVGGSATTGAWSFVSQPGGGDGALSSMAQSATPATITFTATVTGAYTLRLTTDDPGGVCPAVTDDVIITVNQAATSNAGADQNICGGTVYTLVGTSVGGSATTGAWAITIQPGGGDGMLSSTAQTANPSAVTFSATVPGLYRLRLRTNNPAGPCPAINDFVDITVDQVATANAGADQTVCSADVHALTGSNVGGSATTGAWSIFTQPGGGDGNLSSMAQTATPSAVTFTATVSGVYTLRLTSEDPAGVCAAVTDDVDITVNPVATTSANIDQTICEGDVVTLAGSFGGAAASITWTTSGDGDFDDNTSTTAVYTPGTADIAGGLVTLTITTDDPSGPCPAVSDDTNVTIETAVTTSAGPDQTICAGDDITLAGSFGGSATSITWTTSGDGGFDDDTSTSAIYTPGGNDITNGVVTLTITTDDPPTLCPAVSDDIDITINPAATANAGVDQAICEGDMAVLAGALGGSAASIMWTTSGDGSFDDNASTSAVYTPGVNDITNGTVTLTITTDDPPGPCPVVSDDMDITIDPAAIVSAGSDQSICAGADATLSGSYGGSAASIQWTTGGDGSFDDDTSIGAIYTPGANDITNGSVILTITTDDPVGMCGAASDDMTITIPAAPTADLTSADITICQGAGTDLSVDLAGVGPWDLVYTDGVTNFNLNGVVASPATFTVIPATTATFSLVSVADACIAGSVSGTTDVTVTPVNGNPATNGNETWLGYVFDDSGDPNPLPGRIDYSAGKYRGFIDETDIDNINVASYYDAAADTFDLDLDVTAVAGANLCGSYTDNFSIRFRMQRTFAEGAYIFSAGADDGLAMTIDGMDVINDATSFDPIHAYTVYTSNPVCLTAGTHVFVIDYYEVLTTARISFSYTRADPPDLISTDPVALCVNDAAPTLDVTSAYTNVADFNWYSDAGLTNLVFTGASYTPAGAELDMSAAGSTPFFVLALFTSGCESPASTITVDVQDMAILSVTDSTVCELAGTVDLTGLVSALPGGGTFTFTGAGVTGNDFDPLGLMGANTISIDYQLGTCTASSTVDVTVFDMTTVNVPGATTDVCGTGGLFDLSSLVSATPAGGTFTFTGTGVSGSDLDPSGLTGSQTITVDYVVAGCMGTANLSINVTAAATITPSDTEICQAGGSVDLNGFVAASPVGGIFAFSGPGVTGSMFDPSAQSGSVSIGVDYDLSGCVASGTLVMTVLGTSDPKCSGIVTCGSFTITASPAAPSCTTQDDGGLSFIVSGGTPNYIVTLSNGSGYLSAIAGAGPIFTFGNLMPANYTYTIEDVMGETCTLPYTLSVPITVTANTNPSSFEDVICFDQPTGRAVITASGSGTGEYYFSLDGAIWTKFTPGNAITTLPPNGTFPVIIGESDGDVCGDTVSVTINNLATSVLEASISGIDKSVPLPEMPTGSLMVEGFAGGMSPYEVKIALDSASVPGQSFSTTTFEVVTPDINGDLTRLYDGLPAGRYTVSVRDDLGCVITMRPLVPLDIDLFVPNVFTPNGDSMNETFFIRNLPDGTRIIITNRWGKEVFVSNNYDGQWDGGQENEGVYYYRLDVLGTVKSGWVEIIRGTKP